MTTKVFDTISKYKMIEKGDTVAVCLSGGADSMALFHFLCCNKEILEIKVMALHVNHGLRRVSDEEEIFVKDYCEKMGVDCVVYVADMNNKEKPKGLSTESWARDLRYKFFYDMADKYHAKLATAHTASDRSETVLFNITRGAALKGASGIPPVRDNIIRPIINCSRKEIEQYCKENNIPYVTDQTNFDDVYSRNKIRLNVLPELKKINPAVEKSICFFADECSEVYTLLTQLSDNLYRKSAEENGLRVSELMSAHPAVVKNLLRNILDGLDCLSRDNIDSVYQALSLPEYKRQLSDTIFCTVKNGLLSFDRKKEKIENQKTEIEVEMNKIINFRHLNLIFNLVSYDEYKKIKENDKNHLTYCAKYDKMNNRLILRTRKTGDKFTLQKRNVTKTLKKLFIEDKVPSSKRDEIAILSNEKDEVIWLSGYGTNKEFIPEPKEKKVLLIQQTHQCMED